MSRLLPSHLRPLPQAVEQTPYHDWLLGPEALAKFFALDLKVEKERRKFYRLKHLKKNPVPFRKVDGFGLSGHIPELRAWLNDFAGS